MPIPTVPAIVTDVEVPINGMLWVAFEVLVQSAPGGSVAAGLYIDGVQAATVAQAAPPGFTALQAMTAGSEARLLSADASFAFSIITDIPDWFTAAHRTRGVGWLGFFRQGGGTFDVEIRMGVISGTIEVREHLLLVKSESFDNPNV